MSVFINNEDVYNQWLRVEFDCIIFIIILFMNLNSVFLIN